MGDTPHTIDVVLTSHNGPLATGDCLTALAALTTTTASVRIVVGAADANAVASAAAGREGVSVCPSADSADPASGLNGAIAACTADIVAVICDCVTPGPAWLASVVDRARERPEEGMWASVVLAHGTVARVESAGLSASRDGVPYLAGARAPLWSLPVSDNAPLGFDSRAAFFRRSALPANETFAPGRVTLATDFDLALRLARAGVVCSLLRSASVERRDAPCPAHVPPPAHALERDAVLGLVGVMPPTWLATHLPGHAASGIAGAFRKPWRKTSWRALGAKLGVMAGLPGAALKRLRAEGAPPAGDRVLEELFIDPRPRPAAPGASPATASTAESERVELEHAAERETVTRTRRVTLRVREDDGKVASRARMHVEQTSAAFRFGADVSFMDLPGASSSVQAVATDAARVFNSARIDLALLPTVDLDALERRVAWCRESGLAVCVSLAVSTPGASVHAAARRLDDAVAIWEVVAAPRDLTDGVRRARELPGMVRGDVMLTAEGVPGYFDAIDAALDTLDAERSALPRLIGIDARLPHPHRLPLDHVRWTIDRFATLGRELHVTGFSPPAGGCAVSGSHLSGYWEREGQADYAEQFYRVCHSHPSVGGIWWGEIGPWTRAGGMWRADSTPRPVRARIASLIDGEWRTRATVTTNADGRAEFVGRFGHYRAASHPDGGPSGSFAIAREGGTELDVRLEE